MSLSAYEIKHASVVDDECSGLYGLDGAPNTRAFGLGLELLSRLMVFSAVVTFGLAVLCGELGSKLVKAEELRRVARGEAWLDSAVDAVLALPLQSVRALDGASWCDGERGESSDFRVDLRVTAQKDGRIEVLGQLVDSRTGAFGRRFTTHRGKG